MTSKLALQWLPCQAPGVIGSALGLVGPVSVYCDWVSLNVWSATSVSVWQHVKLSEQIRPWDTLACCWDVKQPTNKQTNLTSRHKLCRTYRSLLYPPPLPHRLLHDPPYTSTQTMPLMFLPKPSVSVSSSTLYPSQYRSFFTQTFYPCLYPTCLWRSIPLYIECKPHVKPLYQTSWNYLYPNPPHRSTKSVSLTS